MAAETCAVRRNALKDILSLVEQMIKINETAAVEEEELLNARLGDAAVSDAVQLTLDAGEAISDEVAALLTAETWDYSKRLV